MLYKHTALSLILFVCYCEQVLMWHMSEICSPFSCLLGMSSFASVPIVFRHFFTWIALGDVDLCFLLMFVRKANAIEEETI
jgi:hypothetical protein